MVKSLIIFSSLLLFSCTKEIPIINNSNPSFFNSIELGENNENLRFFISASFDECGEWGGHNEILEFFGKDREVYLNYRKSKVDCNKIGELYGKPEFDQWIANDTLKINDTHKIAINKYLKSLIDSKLSEEFSGHAGRSFSANKTDSTFTINVYDGDDYNINTRNYNQLLQSFKLDTVLVNQK